MLRLRATFFAAFSVLWAAIALAAPQFPALSGRVVDQAGVLTPDQVTMLSNKLATYEQQSGHQIAIATVNSLEGLDIRDYGYQLGRFWALGQKGKNDGVLVLVAPNEHKVSIEVGYGLEGDLTDAVSSVIINTQMVPKFRSGNYIGGLWDGTDAVIKVVGGQGGEYVAAAQKQGAQAQDPLAAFIFVAVFIIILLIVFRASRGRGVVFVPGGFGGYGGGVRSGGSSWSSGGGFSGGGGSFGGGGASGSW
jgi:uncharacterized protein